MSRRNRCPRETQRELFAPPPQTPTWPRIPAKAQMRTIRLLAQILRGYQTTAAASARKEGADER